MLETVVIVDDSATARMIMKRCLKIAGCGESSFLEAQDGAEALELAKQNKVDLVVTDLNMPTMDGMALLKTIKASQNLSQLPVLIISSTNNSVKEKKLLNEGAYAVLNKPISPAQLAQKLQSLIEQPTWGT